MTLDGAHLGEPGPLEAGDGGQAGPGRQDDVVRAEAAAVRQDELGPGVDGGHRALDERHARLPAGRDQRGEQGPVVDLVVARHLDPAAQRGAERGTSARHSLALRRRATRPSECWYARRSSRLARSDASSATVTVPVVS